MAIRLAVAAGHPMQCRESGLNRKLGALAGEVSGCTGHRGGQEFQAAAAQRQYRDLYRLCEEIQQPRGGGSGDPALG